MTQGHRDTQEEYHVMTEAEIGVMQLPAQDGQGLTVITRIWEDARKDSPSETPEGTNIADTFMSDSSRTVGKYISVVQATHPVDGILL